MVSWVMDTSPALFLDDDRFPPDDGRSWVIVRTVPQAVRWIKAHGVPHHISLDNDLGRRQEGRHLVSWMIRVDIDHAGTFIPDNLTFYVHSQNCVNGMDNKLTHHLRTRHQTLARLKGPR